MFSNKKRPFRKKLLSFHLILACIFLSLNLSISGRFFEAVVHRAMKIASNSLLKGLKNIKEPQEMVQFLWQDQTSGFFYLTLINDQKEILFDTTAYEQNPIDVEKIATDFQKGKPLERGGSKQPWTTFTQSFHLDGNTYLVTVALTYQQVLFCASHLRWAFTVFGCLFAALYFVLHWWGFKRLTRPFVDMAAAVKPYSMGKTDIIPSVSIRRSMAQELRHIASAFNAISEKLRERSSVLTDEKGEKEAIFESLMEGVIILDPTGIVKYMNHTAGNMLATPRRQIIGKPFMPFETHPRLEIFKRAQSLIRMATDGGNVVTDSISFGDAQKMHLDLIAIPKPLRKGAILILQDKSSQYKVVEMGKDFIANASHELRTPITIIKGFAETLQDLPSISRPMLTEITEKIVRNCHRMDTLVKNLLTLADIEYVPEHRFQSCDIVALVDNCRHLLLNLAPHAEVDIEKSHERIMADADPDLLELAIMNLLENGVKYSQNTPHLTIYIKQQADEVLIAVQDRGIGIPKDDLQHVFERFYTVDKAHSRRLGGAGLGLSIVKTIIEKHEGTVSVASVVGQGTTFTILLPEHRQAYLMATR